MILTFVRQKSQVTTEMEKYAADGYNTYRVRLNCNCTVNPRRSGVIIINPATQTLTATIIRCKGCKNREEASNGR